MDKHKTIQYIIVGVALIVALVGSYFGIQLPAPVIPEPGVPAGDIPVDMPIQSYYAEGDTNFTNVVASGDVSVGDDLTVTDDASVGGDLTVTGALSSAALTPSSLTVSGATALNGGLTMDTTAFIVADTSGNTTIAGTLDVAGNVSSATGGVTITDSLNVTSTVDLDSTLNVDGNVTLNGTLDVDGNISSGTGAVTVTDTMNVSGNFTLQALLLSSFADLTVTDGDTLTPTVTTYALDSAGAVTLTLAASATEGQILILIGDDANNITIADTNIRTNDGNAQVLNQYDVLMLIYQDSEWIEISNSDNS